jgi:hypothetical protein
MLCISHKLILAKSLYTSNMVSASCKHILPAFSSFPRHMGIAKNTTAIAAKTKRVRIILNLDSPVLPPPTLLV